MFNNKKLWKFFGTKNYRKSVKKKSIIFSKRSSLEISVQAIVIVVLAMTLLGLGLGFIKGMFGKIGGLTDSTFGKLEEQLQRDLTTSNEALAFSQTKITVERGKPLLLGWGIKNDGRSRLDYYVQFTPVSCPIVAGGTSSCDIVTINNWFTYKVKTSKNPAPYSVEAASQKVERVDLTVPKSPSPDTGLYLIELSVWDIDDTTRPYSTTDIFVTVS